LPNTSIPHSSANPSAPPVEGMKMSLSPPHDGHTNSTSLPREESTAP
jgi:hypothetical protein